MENFVLDYPVLSHCISNNLWSRVWYKSENCSSYHTSSWNIYTDIFWNNFLDRINTIFWSFYNQGYIYTYILHIKRCCWVVSGVAIKKGYANELSKSRTVTLALLIGIIIGYILGNIIPLE